MSDSAFEHIERLRSWQAQPFSGPVPAAAIEDTLRDVEALAADAYAERRPEALDRAERVLHYLNVAHGFGLPVHPVLCLTWSCLAQGLVRCTLQAHTVPAEITREQLEVGLEEAVVIAERRDHSFIDEICALPSDLGLIVYGKNWLASTQGFTNTLLALAQRTTGAARATILDNIGDEISGRTHEQMRARFFAELGWDYDDVRGISTYQAGKRNDPQLLVSSLTLLNIRTALVSNIDPTWALGVFYLMEAGFHAVCKRMATGLSRRRFPDEASEIFRVHVEADEGHAKEWRELVAGDGWSPVDRARVLQGVNAYQGLRHAWFDAMRGALAR
jgi:hypothetical protein